MQTKFGESQKAYKSVFLQVYVWDQIKLDSFL